MIDLKTLKETGTAPSTGAASLVVRNRTSVAPKTTADAFDEATRSVYVFDCSGSMGAYVFRPSDISRFNWNMKLVRAHIQKQVVDAVTAAALSSRSQDYSMVALMIFDHPMDLAAWSYCVEFNNHAPRVIADDDLLKLRIIEQGLQVGYFPYDAVNLDYSRTHNLTTRLQLLTKTAIEQIDERVAKYPGAEFEVLYFDHRVRRLNAATLDSLKAAMHAVEPSGGTDIRSAMEKALRTACKPAANIAVNHIIFGTDGEDYSGVTCGELFGELVQKHVVLDYIYIKSSSGPGRDVAKVMQELCAKTGGKYVEVTTADELESKLVDAARRKCLPPVGA